MKASIFSNKKLPLTLTLFVLLGMLVSIAACNLAGNEDDPFADLPPLYPAETENLTDIIRVESVEVMLDYTVFERGSLIIPRVTIYPTNATNQDYTLYTYDESVLRKSDGGFIATGSGFAEIIVLAADGATDWISLTVVVSVQRVTLDVQELNLGIGESKRLTSTIFPADATFHSTLFSSSNPSVATVSQFGTVQAISAGYTEIIFSVDDFNVSVMVTVEIPVTGISIQVDRSVFAIGDIGSFVVRFTPEDATNLAYDVSLGEGIELLDDNRFEVTAAGEIEISVSSHNDLTASETITVIDLELLANQVFELTNVHRADANLPAFTQMRQLRLAAEARAGEIIQYFSHTRPDGRSVFTVFPEFNITFMVAGENIAMGQTTAQEVVIAWMNSPGHRENILRSDFAQLGIGVAMDNNGVLYWAQLFMN